MDACDQDTDWQNQDPESRFSEGDTPARPASQPIMHTSKPVRKPGGSSRRKESFDSNLSSALEAPVHLGSSQRETFDLDVNTRSRRPHGADRYDNHATATVRNTSDGEECTDGQLLADLQDANSMERRIHLINKYRQSFEMRLAAAMHRNELTEGHLTAALIAKEEVEKNLASLSKSKQKAEGKLAAALKVQMDLKDRVVFAEQAQEDSNNLCNVVHSENLRLEHDLAFFKAVLEDTQKVTCLPLFALPSLKTESHVVIPGPSIPIQSKLSICPQTDEDHENYPFLSFSLVKLIDLSLWGLLCRNCILPEEFLQESVQGLSSCRYKCLDE